jgi:hypothetical protein
MPTSHLNQYHPTNLASLARHARFLRKFGERISKFSIALSIWNTFVVTGACFGLCGAVSLLNFFVTWFSMPQHPRIWTQTSPRSKRNVNIGCRICLSQFGGGCL